jgi:hypothetical protein
VSRGDHLLDRPDGGEPAGQRVLGARNDLVDAERGRVGQQVGERPVGGRVPCGIGNVAVASVTNSTR